VAALLLYLDQNYLSGIVKRKPAFRELEPVLRAAVAGGTVATEIESSCTPAKPVSGARRASFRIAGNASRSVALECLSVPCFQWRGVATAAVFAPVRCRCSNRAAEGG
jgi:hypothetical protein